MRPRHYSDDWLYEILYQGTRFKVQRASGIVVRSGETVTDFRGDTWEFLYGSAARVPGKTGKVVVADSSGGQREFYDTVFDLEVERR